MSQNVIAHEICGVWVHPKCREKYQAARRVRGLAAGWDAIIYEWHPMTESNRTCRHCNKSLVGGAR
jgi:hypothetical protein